VSIFFRCGGHDTPGPMDCSICLADLTRGSLLVTPCGHPFHQPCLLQSLEHKPLCPLCKARVREAACHALFLPSVNGGILDTSLTGETLELREKVQLLESQLRESQEGHKKMHSRLKDVEAKRATMMGELKALAHTYKVNEENRRAAEQTVVELEVRLAEQTRTAEQLQSLVQLHNIRRTGEDLPEDYSNLNPQQKEDHIRNQRQMLTWARADLKEMQAEKRDLCRRIETLEATVASLTRRLNRHQDRDTGRSPLRELQPRMMVPDGGPSPKRPRHAPPLDALDAGAPGIREAEQMSPNTGESSPGPVADHSIIEIADSSLEEDREAPEDALAHEAPNPPPDAPAVAVPMIHRPRSFLTATAGGNAAPARHNKPHGVAAFFPVQAAPPRAHDTTFQPTLTSLLRRR